ncbi:MAG: GNAT family N-acetyltransferase [Stackebrandtia sp.]
MNDIEFSWLSALNSDEVDQWADVVDRWIAADLPGDPSLDRASSIVGLTRSPTSGRTRHLLAKRDGQVVGVAELRFSLLDNLHLMEMEDLIVDPRRRNAGVGSALLAEVERHAAAEGRTTFLTYVCMSIEGGPPRSEAGRKFAEKHGYVRAAAEIRRRADLREADESDLDDMLASAWKKADGYELVRWISTAPDDIVDDVAYLDSRLIQDAPTGDMDIEPHKVDAARVRERERESLAKGQLRVNTGVRHAASGRLVGWTDIIVMSGSETDAWQGITLVDPEHRGRRLGTILKIENHRQLRRYRPMMRYVHTWNDDANSHMIGINEAVGYRAVDQWVAYQKKRDK